MDIVHSDIESYLRSLFTVDEPVLREMEEYGDSRGFPIVGPLVGRILMQYARSARAENILELGSGFGYSAAWFFLGIMTGGRIICTDMSDENIERGKHYLTRLGATGVVSYKKGDALKILDSLDGPFDIIFCDIDKEEYPDAFKAALPKLKSGGLFITDNTLWKGKVTQPDPDETTRAVLEYNRLIFSTPEVMSNIIPLRDGVAVSLKL